MFCKYCGKELSSTAHFCPQCGTAVNAQSAPAPRPQPKRETLLTKTFTKKGKKQRALWDEINRWLKENSIEIKEVTLENYLCQEGLRGFVGIDLLQISYVVRPELKKRYQLGCVQYVSAQPHADILHEMMEKWEREHSNYQVVYSRSIKYQAGSGSNGSLAGIFFLFVGSEDELEQDQETHLIVRESRGVTGVRTVVKWFYYMILAGFGFTIFWGLLLYAAGYR